MFAANAKDEVAAASFERICCPATFLSALARFSGRTGLGAGAAIDAKRLVAITEWGSVARAAIRAGKAIGLGVHAQPLATRRLRRRGAVAVIADRWVATVDRPVRRVCCLRAWVRAAYLACGSVADPRRSYHLEFNAPDDAAAHEIAGALSSFRIPAGIMRRRGRPVVYVKSAAAVVELLGQLGASRSVFAFDDVLAVRATKNAIRRKVNSEAANAARAATTAARQRDAALRLGSRQRLDRLTPAIREAVKLRIAHPAATLAELARSARPSITKPAMAARMRAVERLAKRVGSGRL